MREIKNKISGEKYNVYDVKEREDTNGYGLTRRKVHFLIYKNGSWGYVPCDEYESC